LVRLRLVAPAANFGELWISFSGIQVYIKPTASITSRGLLLHSLACFSYSHYVF